MQGDASRLSLHFEHVVDLVAERAEGAVQHKEQQHQEAQASVLIRRTLSTHRAQQIAHTRNQPDLAEDDRAGDQQQAPQEREELPPEAVEAIRVEEHTVPRDELGLHGSRHK